jgi:hypothetical protein
MPPDGPLRRVFGIQSLDEEDHAQAVAAPGPSWSEWFYFEFLKVWLVLGYLILAAIVIAAFADPLNLAAMAGGLVVVGYLEFLGWRYLYYRPDPEKESPLNSQFQPSWIRPVRFGRWTPEMWRIRAGERPYRDNEAGPDPREFL